MTLKNDEKSEEKLYQNWHKEFCEFWLVDSKFSKIYTLFNGLNLTKVYNVWARKVQRSYLS